MTLLITACSKDKCATRPVSAAALGRVRAETLAEDWIGRLQGGDRMAAGQRYIGRGHRHAAASAERHGASHLIMSAGLGFVRASDKIPAYQLTFKKGETDSILPHLAEPDGLADWWTALERHSPWARRLEDEWDGSGLIVVALPADYLQVLSPLLDRLPASARPRLRLINSGPTASLPQPLRAYHLPYDARLDGPDSVNAGIGSDFLGRAAVHFLALTQGVEGNPIAAHRRQVEDVLKAMRPAERRQGRSLPDDAIVAAIRSELDRAGPGSGRILRRFRDELGIACEQKRFQRLYAGAIAREALA